MVFHALDLAPAISTINSAVISFIFLHNSQYNSFKALYCLGNFYGISMKCPEGMSHHIPK